MRFIVFNYSSPSFIQPAYLSEEINKIDGCTSHLSNNMNNIYYLYDRIKPDFGIMNIGGNIRDCIHYNQNTSNKVQHILSIDYLPDNQLDEAKQFIKNDGGLNIKLLISSSSKFKDVDFGVPFVHVANCANSQISKAPEIFNIGTLVISSKKRVNCQYEGTHHVASLGSKIEGADFDLNSLSAIKILQNYQEIVIENIDADNIPEEFFNAIYFGKGRVYFNNEDPSKGAKVNQVLKKILSCDNSFAYNDREQYDLSLIKNKVAEKHVPRNRLKRILSNIKEAQPIVATME